MMCMDRSFKINANILKNKEVYIMVLRLRVATYRLIMIIMIYSGSNYVQ